MGKLTVIGFCLVIGSIAIPSIGTQLWMNLSGFILLLGALAIFADKRRWLLIRALFLFLMFLLFLFGFLEWTIHPLGGVIGFIGIYYVVNILFEINKHIITILLVVNKWIEYKVLVSPYLKYGAIFCVALFVLWLLNSIWITFVVGFGMLIFFDRHILKEQGINRMGMLLMVYIITFLLLLVFAFRTQDITHKHIIFFKAKSYNMLRDVMRVL